MDSVKTEALMDKLDRQQNLTFLFIKIAPSLAIFNPLDSSKSKEENSWSISCSFRDGDGKITLSEFRELFKK